MKKSRLVFVPAPGMGQLVSTVELTKLLINHNDGLSITVFIVKAPASPTSIPTPTLSLPPLIAPNAFNSFTSQLMNLSLLSTYTTASRQRAPCQTDCVRPGARVPLRLRLTQTSRLRCRYVLHSHDRPRQRDGGFSRRLLHIRRCILGLMFHLHPLKEQGILDTTAPNFKDSGTELIAPSYENPMPANVLPSILLEKEWEGFVDEYVKGLRKAKGIIVNTFEELESQALHSLSQGDTRIYRVGPILSAKDDETGQRGAGIIEWLDDQPESSVLFLCFGSMDYFREDQVREIARALENSGVRFLWSLRKPPPGVQEAPLFTDYPDPAEVLQEGFVYRTWSIRKGIGWDPQPKSWPTKQWEVLCAPAVGNSILERVYFGVPIANWPLYEGQPPNAFELVLELKMAVKISLEYKTDSKKGSAWEGISAEGIEKGIKEVMEREREVRKKVKEISDWWRVDLPTPTWGRFNQS